MKPPISLDDFKPLPVPDPEYLDRSTLERYATCPFQGDAVEEKLVQDTNELAQIGIEGHRLIADAFEHGRASYGEVDSWLENELLVCRPDIQPQVIQALKRFIHRVNQIQMSNILGVEKQYSTEYEPATQTKGALLLTQCFDLVMAGRADDTLIVDDWKSGWKQRSNSEAFNSFQTQFGAWLLWKEIENVNTIHWFYHQTRYDSTAYAKLERERDFYNFAGRLQSAVMLWRSGSKEAWPEPAKCSWCPCTALCPHVIAEALDFNKDKAAYLNEFMAKSARVAAMRKILVAAAKEGIEIRSGDNVFGDPGRKKISWGAFVNKETEDETESE